MGFGNDFGPKPSDPVEAALWAFAAFSNWNGFHPEDENRFYEFIVVAMQTKMCFPGEPFESAYKKWQTGQISEKQLVAKIESRPTHRQDVQFKTWLLPRDYSSFGQNLKVTGKPC
jgi:hypothetical protein